MFKFPVIEIVDRYCIALLKYRKHGLNKDELEFYEKQVKTLDFSSIEPFIDRLYSVHEIMWEYEDEFKKNIICEKYSLEEIGRRAILIRDLNAQRNALKNKIAETLKDPIRDIKFI
jgi:hypothetical protein